MARTLRVCIQEPKHVGGERAYFLIFFEPLLSRRKTSLCSLIILYRITLGFLGEFAIFQPRFYFVNTIKQDAFNKPNYFF